MVCYGRQEWESRDGGKKRGVLGVLAHQIAATNHHTTAAPTRNSSLHVYIIFVRFLH